MRARLKQRLSALLALALLALILPVGAGLAYLAVQGAPKQFLLRNAAALLCGGFCILLCRMPAHLTGRHLLLALALLALFLPQLTGPHLGETARWLPVGPITLHSGALLFPAIAVLAARESRYAPLILLCALAAAMIQPDAALGFAIFSAATGLFIAGRNWLMGAASIAAFGASIIMAKGDNLPAKPYVEGVLTGLVQTAPLIALLLSAALIASISIILAAPFDRRGKFALAGSLFGFTAISIIGDYPSILIGYGAAPILGFGLALGLLSRENRHIIANSGETHDRPDITPETD